MTASADLSIISLILHASIVVKIVLTILLALSVISWTMIFQKWFQVQRAQKATECGKPDCKVGCECDRFMVFRRQNSKYYMPNLLNWLILEDDCSNSSF